MFGRSHVNITKNLRVHHHDFLTHFYYQSKEQGDLFAIPLGEETRFKLSSKDTSNAKYDAFVTFHQGPELLIIEFDKEKPIHAVVDCSGVYLV